MSSALVILLSAFLGAFLCVISFAIYSLWIFETSRSPYDSLNIYGTPDDDPREVNNSE